MAEAFLRLTTKDRLDALGVAADRLGRPAHLLEKDVWVVWAIQQLFGSPVGTNLVFKGGTSLSKAYQVISTAASKASQAAQYLMGMMAAE